MRILIAESKTMAACTGTVAAVAMAGHRPRLDSIATFFMEDWGKWPVDEIANTLKISVPMSQQFKRMAYEFPNKGTGCKALEAFTGVVFKALDYSSLSIEEKERADNTVDIISSLYGWLRGGDIVKPYRLDFTTKVAPTGESMAGYFKRLITPLLLESMTEANEDEILDLLPTDAEKCLDWRWIKRQKRVLKVDFRSMTSGGQLTTPHATLLKTLRGRLLRDIIVHDIHSFTDLMAYESPTMCIDPDSNPSSGKITILFP